MLLLLVRSLTCEPLHRKEKGVCILGKVKSKEGDVVEGRRRGERLTAVAKDAGHGIL
jgi:hypothetical protein